MKTLITTGFKGEYRAGEDPIFAGDWCFFDQSHLPPASKAQIFKYPFSARETQKANRAIYEAYQELLTELPKVLDPIYGWDGNQRAYSIYLGRWLFHFLHDFYEKYTLLTEISRCFPKIRQRRISFPAVSCRDYLDYALNSYSNHYFNYLQFGAISNLVDGIAVEETDACFVESFFHARSKLSFSELRGKLFRLLCSINGSLQKDMVLIVDPYYESQQGQNILSMFVLSKARILHDLGTLSIPPIEANIDLSLRESLRDKLLNASMGKLAHLSSHLVFQFLPQSFIETFSEYRGQALKLQAKTGPIQRFFTCNALHSNTLFKMLVALSQDSELWVSQHGGAYGYARFYSAEEYEKCLSQKYFSWGWQEPVLPHPKILKKPSEVQDRILLTFPSVTYYSGLLESIYNSTNVCKTYENTDRFLDLLDPLIQSRICFRQLKNPGLRRFEKTGFKADTIQNFGTSLMSARLHLTNHMGTPALESLAANRPTLILFDPLVTVVRSQAVSYFKRLEEVGIIFTDPTRAARHLNDCFPRLETWWAEPQVQSARQEFCRQFARQDPHWKRQWIRELLV